MLFGQGGNVGPDLTGSGRMELDYVLSNLIDPSATIDPAYRLTTVFTKSGQFFSGFIIEQDAQNFLRFDVYSTGTNPHLFATRFVNGVPTALTNYPVSVSSPVWLRVNRTGDVWSFDYSVDGVA